jgi:hypothetical protein
MSRTNGEIDSVFAGLNSKLLKFKEEFGVETVQRVQKRTPVVTGDAQRGWGFERKASDIEIYNVSDHAYFLEYGTQHMAPRGMLRVTLLEAADIAKVAAQKAGLK